MTQDEWNKLPPYIRSALERQGGHYGMVEKPSAKSAPYTRAGLTQSEEFLAPLRSENILGYNKPVTTGEGRATSYSVYNDDVDKKHLPLTRAHEAEHALERQGIGGVNSINSLWNSLVGRSGSDRGEIVNRLVQHAPHLVKNYGLPDKHKESGYFSSRVLKDSDSRNYLDEQLATLSALEQTSGKRLVEDPYVRKHILKTPAEREAYEALTGLRQTRLDAKDLPPYTRQPGSTSTKEDPDDQGFMAKIKSMLGMYQGGLVNKNKD
jgi:hypothetical protein